jgi:hypothetical protein
MPAAANYSNSMQRLAKKRKPFRGMMRLFLCVAAFFGNAVWLFVSERRLWIGARLY